QHEKPEGKADCRAAARRGEQSLSRNRRPGRRSQQGDGRRLVGDDRAPAEGERPESSRRLRPRQHGDGLPAGRPDRRAEGRALSRAEEHLGRVEISAVRAGILGLIAAATMLAAAPTVAALRGVAATSDMAALVAVVGGELVAVETLVPAATDREAFEPRPADIDRVRRARLLVRVGLGYDAWLEPLIAKIGDARLARGGDGYVDASVGI